MKETRFKQLLKEKGVSCSNLAKELNLSSMAVYNWINGDKIPPVKRFQEIASALSVSINEVTECFIEDTKKGA